MDSKWVFVISTMRSGSTLLKALLATRKDVSDLPETRFSKIDIVNCDQPLKVIKSPAAFIDFEYPVLPDVFAKKIILIRNPYDTVISLQQMMKINPRFDILFMDEAILLGYWLIIYRNILQKLDINDHENTILIKYEDMIDKTIDTTSKIFSFIGCHDTKGIDYYSTPQSYFWKWGSDDGGEVIKTLKVQTINRVRDNERLLHLINCSKEVRNIMQSYGYENL